MVGREVQALEHMPVVLYFRTLGDGESHGAENGYYLVAYQRERMACAARHRRSGARQVQIHVYVAVAAFETFLQCVDAFLSLVLQLVYLLTDLTLQFGRHRAEIRHQRRYQTFLAQVLYTQFLDRFLCCGRLVGKLLTQRFYPL